MASHFLLALFSLIAYSHVASSTVTPQQMLAAATNFSKDFAWPRISEVAYVLNYHLSATSCLTEQQCPDQLHRIYSRWYVYFRRLHEV